MCDTAGSPESEARAGRQRAGRWLAVGVIVISLNGLIGCFAVPATKKFQPNGKRIPEALVGTTADKKIVPGLTRLDAAIIALADQIDTSNYAHLMFGPATKVGGSNAKFFWTSIRVSPSGREFAIPYQVRTSTEVWPLCFTAGPRIEQRLLVLTINNESTVVRVDTLKSHRDARFGQSYTNRTNAGQLLQALNEPTRTALQEAGLLPDDEALREIQRRADDLNAQYEADKEASRQRAATRRAARDAATTLPATQPSAAD